MNIVFVCNGNRSRSPMAAAYFNQLCTQNNIPAQASSAGLKVEEPRPATADAVELFELLQIDLKKHLSQPLNADIINQASAIVCMTKDQIDAIDSIAPAKDKTRTILSLVGSDDDLKDPEKGILESFQECFQTIMPALAELGDRILRSQV